MTTHSSQCIYIQLVTMNGNSQPGRFGKIQSLSGQGTWTALHKKAHPSIFIVSSSLPDSSCTYSEVAIDTILF